MAKSSWNEGKRNTEAIPKKPLLVMEEGKLDLTNGRDKKNIEVKVGNG